MDNPISREAFKTELLKQLEEEQKLEANEESTVMTDPRINRQIINYYYKRWLWVQFPWWCINVYSSISSLMTQAISLSSISDEERRKMTLQEQARLEIFFSIAQENDLVIKSLNILKEAKLRKQSDF